MARPPATPSRPKRRGKGFAAAGGLVQPQIQAVGRKRGFAVARLLTHWSEVVGPEIAALCQPVKVAYGRGGLGATLTVLARGAAGPMLQAQLATIKERVNGCYGYAAISKIRITQTAPGGFSEQPQSAFDHRGSAGPEIDESSQRAAQSLADGVNDPDLRDALANLGARVISRPGH